MGQVYGRMSVPGAVGLYSARWSAGDHHASCPSKAKPGLRDSNNKLSSATVDGGARRRRRSLSIDSNYSAERYGVRLTRQAARQLALQRAAQQAASIRRSARLAGTRSSATGVRGGRSSSASNGAAATLPTTLRRSARIAGFRYIGHRMAANFSSPLSMGARLRRIDSAAPSTVARPTSTVASAPPAPSRVAPSEPRRSIRLMRA